MPKNKILPYEWFDTPNIHLCSVNDFIQLCDNNRIKINDKVLLNEDGKKLWSKFFKKLIYLSSYFLCFKKIVF